jgi:hypothetical protein
MSASVRILNDRVGNSAIEYSASTRLHAFPVADTINVRITLTTETSFLQRSSPLDRRAHESHCDFVALARATSGADVQNGPGILRARRKSTPFMLSGSVLRAAQKTGLHTCFFEASLEILAVHHGCEVNGCAEFLE